MHHIIQLYHGISTVLILFPKEPLVDMSAPPQKMETNAAKWTEREQTLSEYLEKIVALFRKCFIQVKINSSYLFVFSAIFAHCLKPFVVFIETNLEK